MFQDIACAYKDAFNNFLPQLCDMFEYASIGGTTVLLSISVIFLGQSLGSFFTWLWWAGGRDKMRHKVSYKNHAILWYSLSSIAAFACLGLYMVMSYRVGASQLFTISLQNGFGAGGGQGRISVGGSWMIAAVAFFLSFIPIIFLAFNPGHSQAYNEFDDIYYDASKVQEGCGVEITHYSNPAFAHAMGGEVFHNHVEGVQEINGDHNERNSLFVMESSNSMQYRHTAYGGGLKEAVDNTELVRWKAIADDEHKTMQNTETGSQGGSAMGSIFNKIKSKFVASSQNESNMDVNKNDSAPSAKNSFANRDSEQFSITVPSSASIGNWNVSSSANINNSFVINGDGSTSHYVGSAFIDEGGEENDDDEYFKNIPS